MTKFRPFWSESAQPSRVWTQLNTSQIGGLRALIDFDGGRATHLHTAQCLTAFANQKTSFWRSDQSKIRRVGWLKVSNSFNPFEIWNNIVRDHIRSSEVSVRGENNVWNLGFVCRNAARSKYKEAPRSRKSLWGKVVNSKGENWIEKLWKAKGQNKNLQRAKKQETTTGRKTKMEKKEPWNVNKTLSTSQDSLGIITFDTVATQQLKRFALLCSLALSVPHVPYKTLRASHQQHLDPPATTSVDDVWYQEWSVMINGKKTPSLDKFSCRIRCWPPWTRRPQHPEGLQRKNNNKTKHGKSRLWWLGCLFGLTLARSLELPPALLEISHRFTAWWERKT